MFYNVIHFLFLSIFGFFSKIMNSLISLIILYILYVIVKKIFKNLFSRKIFNSRLEKSHKQTIETLITSIIKYSFITLGVLFIIQHFVGNVALTITSIIGVALGFASQSVVKDLINGIFITFENQFTVGDYISINKDSGELSGMVEAVTARVTKLKDFNGEYHIIPNGLINVVTNNSKVDSRILVDIEIDSKEKNQKVIEAIDFVLEAFSDENITVRPYIYGVTKVNVFSVNYRVIGYANPLKHWDIENNLRVLILDEIVKRNISLPVSKHSIEKN